MFHQQTSTQCEGFKNKNFVKNKWLLKMRISRHYLIYFDYLTMLTFGILQNRDTKSMIRTEKWKWYWNGNYGYRFMMLNWLKWLIVSESRKQVPMMSNKWWNLLLMIQQDKMVNSTRDNSQKKPR